PAPRQRVAEYARRLPGAGADRPAQSAEDLGGAAAGSARFRDPAGRQLGRALVVCRGGAATDREATAGALGGSEWRTYPLTAADWFTALPGREPAGTIRAYRRSPLL